MTPLRLGLDHDTSRRVHHGFIENICSVPVSGGGGSFNFPIKSFVDTNFATYDGTAKEITIQKTDKYRVTIKGRIKGNLKFNDSDSGLVFGKLIVGGGFLVGDFYQYVDFSSTPALAGTIPTGSGGSSVDSFFSHSWEASYESSDVLSFRTYSFGGGTGTIAFGVSAEITIEPVGM